jgi:hypothetical protein
MRWGLIKALDEWPAVGSDDWEKALSEGIQLLEVDAQARVRERLRSIFCAAARRDSRRYANDEISRRTQVVARWLAARRSTVEGDDTEAWDAALAQCRALISLIDLVGETHWAEADVQRSLRLARGAAPPERTYPAEAGLASVSSPAAIVGPACRVAWWRFDRSSAPVFRTIPLARGERSQLAELGVELPDPGAETIRAATRWRRPLELANDAVLLVCPTRDALGEECYPHPLWDEIRSHLARDAREAALVVEHASRNRCPPIQRRSLLKTPAPQREWQVDERLIPRRERESNTSVETLLQCSLRWTIRYGAGLSSRSSASGEVNPRVLGRMAHALLSEVVPIAASPEEASELASRWLEDHGPRRVGSLFLPGREAHKARVRRILCASAEQLSRLLASGRLQVHLTEERILGRGLGRELLGIPDFILTPGPIIVDAKWGGVSRRRDQLRNGTASQLAFYAELARQQPEFAGGEPAVAFFVLEAGRILTTDAYLPPPTERIRGPSHTEVWRTLESAFDKTWTAVERGSLTAPGNPDGNGEISPEKDSVSEDGRLILSPPCNWCDYSGLCGAAFASELR